MLEVMGAGGRETSDRLPVALSSFVGRAGEARAVSELCMRHRVVTLTGAGGCGKTRLALHVAGRVGRGQVTWVELAPLARGDVTEHLSRTLGLGVAPTVDPLDSVTTALATHEGLLVLDNAEHVLDEVATTAVRIAQRCPAVNLLVTSREPLGVPGEIIWRVPSLAVPPVGTPISEIGRYDAARLFIERASHQRPSLVLDHVAAEHIVAICTRLDGMPLAIELAAARARTLALDRLAAGLDDAFRMLTGGDRTALARQQTLRSSIQWSYDLLDPPDRVVLRRLSTFQGPFTVEAAEAVASDGGLVVTGDVLDSLARLVDKSLVQFDDHTGRYRVLETVRQFGAEAQRAADDDAPTRDRHAAWWAAFCTAVGRGEHGLTAASVLWAMPDISDAADWARTRSPALHHRIVRGLGWSHTGLAHWSHLERCYEAVVDTPEAERDADWAAAVAGLGWPVILLQRSELFDLLPAVARLVAGDPGTEHLLRYAPALVEAFGGRPDAMRSLAHDVVEAGDRLACPHVVGAMLSVAQALGHFDEAHRMWDALGTLLASHGLRYSCDTAMVGHYGTIYLLIDEGRLQEARSLADSASEPADITMVVATAAAVATLASVLDDAEMMARAERWVTGEAAPVSANVAGYVRGLAAWTAGRTDEAARHLLHVLATDDLTGPMFHPQYRRFVRVLLDAGRVEGAETHVAAAFERIRELDDPPLPLASLHVARAMVAAAQGRTRDALHDAHGALDIAHAEGFVLLRLAALDLVAALHANRQQYRTAARILGAALAERARIGSREHCSVDRVTHAALVVDLERREPAALSDGASTSVDEIVAYARRARGERSRPSVGWDSLTPTERRVADLVAQGQSNAAIAKALLMSPATVKTHLTHTFTKLGIGNRTELASLVLRDEPTT